MELHLALPVRQQDAGAHPLIDGGAPTGTVGWLINPDGVPLIGLSYDKDRLFLHLYDKANKSWSKLADLDRYDSHDFEPSFVDYQDTLYVKRAIGENSSGLYRYDLKARKIADEPIAQLDGFDFDAVPIFDLKARKFIGLHYQSDAWDTSWIDPAMKMLQKRIDEKLPGTINTISCGNCLSSAAYLITVRSDRSPEQYLLYRPGKDELVPIGTHIPTSRPSRWAAATSSGLRHATDCPSRSM
ncbi:hypothetical protein [Chitinimonas koreensis]|uniref:hypothetical protein n=1 Tax=Chitinimonas koreensis TaxID=356302 RepID=UPI001654132B|nr:hypothetical protein [Chitinimonas koreensis]QNM94840.1 hypothetical protein H9L41_12940 [Chitinimonas koreensis]